MPIEKQTKLNKVEITDNGMVLFRLALCLVEDGKEISNKWHRSGVEPGGDIDAQFAAVNAHLIQMGQMPVSADDIERVRAQAIAAWTPEVVSAYQLSQE
jgi:hypothetical protein